LTFEREAFASAAWKERPVGDREIERLSYSLGATSRLTGVSPALMRAWEKRYGAVSPQRTPGGTRRYHSADVERLRLLRALVDAGERIGRVAALDMHELQRRAEALSRPVAPPLEAVLLALERLDGAEVERLLSLQLASLGPLRFATDFALPLAQAIGERWVSARLSIAAEHLATAALRSLLGSALRPTPTAIPGPRIVFATPEGERHELGLLVAALVSIHASAVPIFLGADLPLDELASAAAASGADAIALGIAALSTEAAQPWLGALRARVPDGVKIWIGGAGSARLVPPAGVKHIATLEAFGEHVALLGAEMARSGRPA